jgi:hypothetical protein
MPLFRRLSLDVLTLGAKAQGDGRTRHGQLMELVLDWVKRAADPPVTGGTPLGTGPSSDLSWSSRSLIYLSGPLPEPERVAWVEPVEAERERNREGSLSLPPKTEQDGNSDGSTSRPCQGKDSSPTTPVPSEMTPPEMNRDVTSASPMATSEFSAPRGDAPPPTRPQPANGSARQYWQALEENNRQYMLDRWGREWPYDGSGNSAEKDLFAGDRDAEQEDVFDGDQDTDEEDLSDDDVDDDEDDGEDEDSDDEDPYDDGQDAADDDPYGDDEDANEEDPFDENGDRDINWEYNEKDWEEEIKAWLLADADSGRGTHST